jgi:hypothetical protein
MTKEEYTAWVCFEKGIRKEEGLGNFDLNDLC